MNALAAAERYYETWGRTWERAALVRARPVAGHPAFGARVLEAPGPQACRAQMGQQESVEFGVPVQKVRRDFLPQLTGRLGRLLDPWGTPGQPCGQCFEQRAAQLGRRQAGGVARQSLLGVAQVCLTVVEVAPGQVAVLYDEDAVVGSGVITGTRG